MKFYDTRLSRSAAHWFVPSKLVKSRRQRLTLSLKTNPTQKISMVRQAQAKEGIPAARQKEKPQPRQHSTQPSQRMPVLQEAAGKQTRSPSSVGTSMQRTISRRNADRISRKSRRTEPQGRSKALLATPITLVTVKPYTISKVDVSESKITWKEIYAEIDESSPDAEQV